MIRSNTRLAMFQPEKQVGTGQKVTTVIRSKQKDKQKIMIARLF